MELNSLPFLLFFFVVFILYYACYKSSKLQNIIILLSSYFFYGFASWKMLPVIIVMTIVFYFFGLKIENYRQEEKNKQAYWLTTLTVVIGLLPLLYFKYFNFFIDSFADLFALFGFNTHHSTFKIIMPLGISFFTFRLISYAVEINRRKLTATKDFIAFASYIAFFPSILSGPIDRANKFLPQLQTNRELLFDNCAEGFKRIIWGWFMKVCVADVLGNYVDAIYNNYYMHSGISILFASILYPFQMYADFAGYSNMAIGIGKMMGITMNENFLRPFFAQNVAQYWRKWHISLTSWLTDYVFMPLNIRFRDLGKLGLILAIAINFILIGFWHGVSWTFGFFGLYYAILYIPLILSGNMNKKGKIKWIHGCIIPPKTLLKIIGTYLLVTLGLIFFRSPSMMDAFSLIGRMFTEKGSIFINANVLVHGITALIILLLKDYKDEAKLERFNLLHSKNVVVRYITIVLLIAYILLFGNLNGGQFIYFQF